MLKIFLLLVGHNENQTHKIFLTMNKKSLGNTFDLVLNQMGIGLSLA